MKPAQYHGTVIFSRLSAGLTTDPLGTHSDPKIPLDWQTLRRGEKGEGWGQGKREGSGPREVRIEKGRGENEGKGRMRWKVK